MGYSAAFWISAALAFLAILATFTHRQPSLEQYERLVARGKPAAVPAAAPPAPAS
jgi:hypothetical protein